ncbi:MAG: gamma-glutamyl-gamma-aminobutyrate hydrolase family protein [Bacillota bacterium]|nr:gamma-glutamyl-gamma-aminobutyrate hydrolase family protein [Bacillota bacterium]
MKPIIGVMPLIDKERASYWMLPGYFHCLSRAGAIPIMLPLTSKREDITVLLNSVNGLLFTGGHDVSPGFYHRKAMGLEDTCPQRDAMEKIALDIAVDLDMPSLGICRGLQFFNAYWGGSLWRDLPTERAGTIEHHQKPPYHIPAHSVNVLKNTALYNILKKEELWVNSYHHQAIKKLAPALEPMAVSPDGLIEAVIYPKASFILGVQWHPEFSYATDEDSMKLIRAFAAACRDFIPKSFTRPHRW